MNHGTSKTTIHINGLGRFGQQLLYHWLRDPKDFELVNLSDQKLTVDQVCTLLLNHDRLDFKSFAPTVIKDQLRLTLSNKKIISIPYHCGEIHSSPDFGLADYWLECSGNFTDADECRKYISGNTKRVLIGATSDNADKTLIVGFNDQELKPSHKVISYGSCTVNAFVPLAAWIDRNMGLLTADVHVIHNTPSYRINADTHPYRKSCTLERMAPELLPKIRPESFYVNYTMIPYSGVSILNIRFKTESINNQEALRRKLIEASSKGELRDLYVFSETPYTAQSALGKTENAIFNLSDVLAYKQNIWLGGFFDNENSAYRFYDLITKISLQEKSSQKDEPESLNQPYSQA